MRSVNCVSIALSAFALLFAPALHAQPTGLQTVVMVLPEGAESAVGPIARAVTAQLSDLPVVFRYRTVSVDEPDLMSIVASAREVALQTDAVAVVWYDPSEGAEVVFFFPDRNRGSAAEGSEPAKADHRLLVRRIDDTADGGRAESIALIMRLALQEVLSGSEVGESLVGFETAHKQQTNSVTDDETPTQPPAAPLPCVEDTDHWIAQRSWFHMQFFSSEQVFVPSFQIGLDVRVHKNMTVAAGYGFIDPVQLQADFVRWWLRRYPVHVGVRIRESQGDLRLGLLLGLVFEIQKFDVQQFSPEFQPEAAQSEFAVSGRLAVEVDYLVADRLTLFAGLGIDIAIRRPFFSVEVVGETAEGIDQMVLLDPWIVQPFIALGGYLEFF